MNIFCDFTTASKKIDGLTQYMMSVLDCMTQKKDNQYFVATRKNQFPVEYEYLKEKDNVHIITTNIRPIGPVRDIQFLFFSLKHRHSFEAIYIPSQQYPIFCKIMKKKVSVGGGVIYTIHDIVYEVIPKKLGRFAVLKRLYIRFVLKCGVKNADNVVVPSFYTKSQILEHHKRLRKYANKINVIYEGFEHLRLGGNANKKIIKRYINEPYYLYVGSSRGHKNLLGLFLAFEQMKDKTCNKLLVVGRMDRLGKKEKEVAKRINKNKKIVYFTGWIDTETLRNIFMGANAFVFPSKAEGFGIPILEAYFYEVPLLCSDIPVFKEITGGKAIFFDIKNTNSMAKTMLDFEKLKKDEIKKMITEQKERLQFFSWEKAAKGILNLIEICKNKTG